jgi:anti-sigma factor RsiW
MPKKTSRKHHHFEGSCQDEIGLIDSFIADQLPADQRRAYEAHLAGCPDCTAFLATYKKTLALTRSFLHSSRNRDAVPRLIQRRPDFAP